MIARMSPVKSQGSRGTCSIFSAIAMMEALFIKDHRMSIDVDAARKQKILPPRIADDIIVVIAAPPSIVPWFHSYMGSLEF